MQTTEKVARYISTNSLFAREDKVLVAVSGGRDSMMLLHLLLSLGYSVEIAHCNFQLRGAESDQDESLVRAFAVEYHVPLHVAQFDTAKVAFEQGVSIQMAARALRYDWFEELRQQHQFAAVAIAQHQQDHIETFFVNLSRGTGLQGLSGIQAKRGFVVRPLLGIDRTEIDAYMAAHHVPYRDDQSNFSTKYIRNYLRLEVIPRLQALHPQFDAIMTQNIANFQESYGLLQEFVDEIRVRIFERNGAATSVNKGKLYPYLDNHPLLYTLFSPFGFERNEIEKISQAVRHHSGGTMLSRSHRMLFDRDEVLIYPVDIILDKEIDAQLIEAGQDSVEWNTRTIILEACSRWELSTDQHIEHVDVDKLVFPLTLRSWMAGDRFQPLGMRENKKISDFFIQEKVSRWQKSTVPILVNGNGEVIWVVGLRLDNRYKITKNTKKVIKFVYR